MYRFTHFQIRRMWVSLWAVPWKPKALKPEMTSTSTVTSTLVRPPAGSTGNEMYKLLIFFLFEPTTAEILFLIGCSIGSQYNCQRNYHQSEPRLAKCRSFHGRQHFMRRRQRRGSEWESACLLRHQMWVCHDGFLSNSKLNHSISCHTQMLQRVSPAWHATSESLGPKTWRLRAKWKLILARTWATSGTLTTRQRRSRYHVPDTIANHRADPASSLTNRWLLWTTELSFVTPRMRPGRRTNPVSFTY